MSGRYSGVWDALKARIEAHCASGELLEDYRFEVGPFEEVHGQSRLPVIRMEQPGISERFAGDQMVAGEMVVDITIGVDRDEGTMALIEAYELVTDAIETTITGTVDPSLGGLLARPIHCQSPEYQATQTAIYARVGVSLYPVPSMRGNRRNVYE